MASIDLLPYSIVVSSGALDALDTLIARHAPAHRYAIVTDDNVARHYLARTCDALTRISSIDRDRVHTVIVPAGEQYKTREQWAAITDTLLAHACARDTTIIALGGGVIGDLAGFVAATYMRGIPVVQIPTTLLAMVDASVGGKTAVDTPAGKNTVGAFHPPSIVIIDPLILASLPPREMTAGFAEVIKHGVIADADELDAVIRVASSMRERGDASAMLAPLIERSVRIKATIVAADERELGLRKVLNFGHTIGHGIEAASDYTLLHGEAIAIGMIAEARLAEASGIAVDGTAERIEKTVSSIGLPARVPSGIDAEHVLRLMRSDKKRRRGSLEYALPMRVGAMAGEATGWGVAITDSSAREIIDALR